jgi:TPR repeat protein
LSVPIYDFAIANEWLAGATTEKYYACCGKSICGGCLDSFIQSGIASKFKCPFCNSDYRSVDDDVEYIRMRVEANDAGAICQLGSYYHGGNGGLQQDWEKAMELYARAGQLGCSKAHNSMADVYTQRGDMKKAKFYLEAAAMAGHEGARCNIGMAEAKSGSMERAVRHWTIAASGGEFYAMHNLLVALENGEVSRESIYSTLTAYNEYCAEMRSEARDAYILMTPQTKVNTGVGP